MRLVICLCSSVPARHASKARRAGGSVAKFFLLPTASCQVPAELRLSAVKFLLLPSLKTEAPRNQKNLLLIVR
jgi:hypothetical protein